MIYNKANLDITNFASKDDTRPAALRGVYLTKEASVATDSYRLIEVSTPDINADDLPSIMPNNDIEGIVPINAIKKASKNIKTNNELPILENVSSEVKGDSIVLNSTDLETTDRVETRLIEEKYPEYKLIMPTDKPGYTIKVNPQYIKDVADYFIKHGAEKHMTIQLYNDDKSAVMFTGKTVAGQTIKALVMPIQGD